MPAPHIVGKIASRVSTALQTIPKEGLLLPGCGRDGERERQHRSRPFVPQQLPGNRVAKIEVVPNPSTKYDPAGTFDATNVSAVLFVSKFARFNPFGELPAWITYDVGAPLNGATNLEAALARQRSMISPRLASMNS